MELITASELSRLEQSGVEVIFPHLYGEYLYYPGGTHREKAIAAFEYDAESIADDSYGSTAKAPSVAFTVWLRGHEVETFTARTGELRDRGHRWYASMLRRYALWRAMRALGV